MTGRRMHHLRLLLVATVLVAGCSGPSLPELQSVADDLPTPAGWEQVDEEAVERCPDPTGSCPRVVRTFVVPADVDFAASFDALVDDAGLEVTTPAMSGCGVAPEPGCSVRSRRDDVSVRATVTESTPGSLTVSVRVTEYVGP